MPKNPQTPEGTPPPDSGDYICLGDVRRTIEAELKSLGWPGYEVRIPFPLEAQKDLAKVINKHFRIVKIRVKGQ